MCEMQYARIWMYCINTFLMIIGLFVAVAASSLSNFYDDIPWKEFEQFTYQPADFVLIGISMMLLAFVGIWATKQDDWTGLQIHKFLFTLLAAVQIGMILMLLLHTPNEVAVQNILLPYFINYQHNKRDADYVDAIQRRFSCCGMTGSDYWGKPENIPKSCCKLDDCNWHPFIVYKKGCTQSLTDAFSNSVVAWFSIAVIFEIISIVMAKRLNDSIQNRLAENQVP